MRDPHKPERGHVVLGDNQRAQLEAAGHPVIRTVKRVR